MKPLLADKFAESLLEVEWEGDATALFSYVQENPDGEESRWHFWDRWSFDQNLKKNTDKRQLENI